MTAHTDTTMREGNAEGTRPRRHFSVEEQVRLLKFHRIEGRFISAIYEENEIRPEIFHHRQRTFFENGAVDYC